MSKHSAKEILVSLQENDIQESSTQTEVKPKQANECEHLTLEEIVEVATLDNLDNNESLVLKVNSHVSQCSVCYKLFYTWREAYKQVERLRSYRDNDTDKAITSALLRNYYNINTNHRSIKNEESEYDFEFQFPCYIIVNNQLWYYPIIKASKVYSVPSILRSERMIENAIPYNEIEFHKILCDSINYEQLGGIGLVEIPMEKDLEIKMVKVFPDTNHLIKELEQLNDKKIYLIILWSRV